MIVDLIRTAIKWPTKKKQTCKPKTAKEQKWKPIIRIELVFLFTRWYTYRYETKLWMACWVCARASELQCALNISEMNTYTECMLFLLLTLLSIHSIAYTFLVCNAHICCFSLFWFVYFGIWVCSFFLSHQIFQKYIYILQI